MPSPQDFVESIQREFGFNSSAGVGLDGAEKTTRIQQGFGNALQLLSRDLYEYEGHFLLELLQNADDNFYASEVEPTLQIEVSEREVVVTNNELGFNFDNVNAICHVGMSTKRARKADATGEKGIGFKAVFKISDRPEVHSNGFHFCFDTKKFGDLGMVSPEWLPGAQHRGGSGETVIALPYRSGQEAPISLKEQFAPELPLFLRRVRRLRLSDTRADISIELRRVDKGKISEVTRTVKSASGSKTESFRFFRQERTASVGDLKEEKREGVDQTTVVVAVPLDAHGGVDRSSSRNVFAFLPVRTSGLPFVLHADFVLNTSRGDVVRDRAWNIRLRNELAAALAESVVAMQQSGSLGQSALRVLCKPDTIADGFMKPIMELALKQLKGMPCVPTDRAGWELPMGVLRPDKDDLWELVEASDVHRLIGKAYLSPSATEIGDALDLLGVQTFTLTHLLLACADSAWLGQHEPKWLADLYRRLNGCSLSPTSNAQIRASRIFLLSSDSLVALDAGQLFRSLNKRTKYGFESDLQVLDGRILAEAEAAGWGKPVEEFLGRLGVRDADALTIIDTHIIPAHRDGAKPPDVERLVAHARYLRDHLEEYRKAKPENENADLALREKIWLLSPRSGAGARSVHRAARLYVGKTYGDPHHLQELFAGEINAHVLADDYLRADKKPQLESWKKLFWALGVNALPRLIVDRSDVKPSPELAALIGADDAARNWRLLKLFDTYWVHWPRGIFSTPYMAETTILKQLRGMQVPITGGGSAPVEGLYMEHEDNRSVFGDSVRYLAERLHCDELIDVMKIVIRPSVDQVLDRLDELADENKTSTLKPIGKLYRFLEQHWEGSQDSIIFRFESCPIVFYKSGKAIKSARSGECCWTVPPSLQPYCDTPGLDNDWAPYADFFTSYLKVRKQLNGAEWVAVLQRLAGAPLDAQQATDLASQVYGQLEASLKRDWMDDEEVPDWMMQARKSECILTDQGDWWQNDDDVFEKDDPALAEVFLGCKELRFIGIPPDRLPKFRRLIKGFGVARVSSAIRTPPNWNQGELSDSLTDRIDQRWLALVRVLFTKHPKKYEAAKESGRLMMLKQLLVRVFSPLRMAVELGGVKREHRFDCYLDKADEELCLLVDADERDSWMSIAHELGKYLDLDDSESNLITLVLQPETDDSVEKILRKSNIQKLPEGELVELEAAIQEPLIVAPASNVETGGEDRSDEIEPRKDKKMQGSEQSGQHGAGPSKMHANTSVDNDLEKTDPIDPANGTNTSLGRDKGSGDKSGSESKSDGHRTKGRGKSRDSNPPTVPDHNRPKEGKVQRRPGRLISYVEPAEDSAGKGEDGSGQQEKREQIDAAAIEYVVLKERDERRDPRVMPHTNPGFDIDSRDAKGSTLRFIEVKGLGGAWGERGVTMSSTQFEFARDQKDLSWLYVVEFASDPQRRKLWRIQDPASRANKFGFDRGWQSAGDEAPPPVPPEARLVPGAKWRFGNGEIGEITNVSGNGAFVKVIAIRVDGTIVTKLGAAHTLEMQVVRD